MVLEIFHTVCALEIDVNDVMNSRRKSKVKRESALETMLGLRCLLYHDAEFIAVIFIGNM